VFNLIRQDLFTVYSMYGAIISQNLRTIGAHFIIVAYLYMYMCTCVLYLARPASALAALIATFSGDNDRPDVITRS
jgi:hypothetical protein